MSVAVPRTYTISFRSKEDKIKAFAFLLNSNFPFKGIDVDTIVIQKDARDALIEKNIKFN